MAGPYSIFYNPAKDPGKRLSPEVVEEIQEVAPSTVVAGAIGEEELAAGAVTASKIGPKAVTEPAYDDHSIPTTAYKPESVDTLALADGSVTPPKCGPGVVTAIDSAGNDIETTEWYGSIDTFNALSVKDPNVTYFTWQ